MFNNIRQSNCGVKACLYYPILSLFNGLTGSFLVLKSTMLGRVIDIIKSITNQTLTPSSTHIHTPCSPHLATSCALRSSSAWAAAGAALVAPPAARTPELAGRGPPNKSHQTKQAKKHNQTRPNQEGYFLSNCAKRTRRIYRQTKGLAHQKNNLIRPEPDQRTN